MMLNIRASAAFEFAAETFLCLMVEPPLGGPAHRVQSERLLTTTVHSCVLRSDLFGNPQRHIVAPAGRFSYEFTARVEVEPNSGLPDEGDGPLPLVVAPEAMPFLLPSRFCESDKLARTAFGEFGHLGDGGSRVLAVADWVRRRVEYRYGTTEATTSALDTLIQRVGVCRDFAHLVIGLCRAQGIPARYASGYALGLETPDFHGFVQVHLGGAWHNVDATTAGIRPALVPIAVGRDAADVAMTTTWVPHTLLEQTVEVREAS